MTRNLLRCCTNAILSLLFTAGILHAQSPVWKQPMANPSQNFYTIQAAFNHDMRHTVREVQRDQTHRSSSQTSAKGEVESGEESEAGMEGYLQFKRWEDYMGPRVFPSGDISLPSTNWDRFQDYLNNNPVAMQMYQQGNSNTSTQRFNGPNTTQSSTWTFAGPTGAPTGGGAGRVGFVRVDPTNNNNLWIGAPAGGLWKSTNGGASWSTNTDFLSVIGASDLAIDPTNTQTMYLATGDGDAGDTYSIGVLKSTDGGTTWNPSGLTWTVNQGRVINKLLINPANTQVIIAISNTGIWRTANGGTSWTQELAVSMQDAEFMPGTPNTVYACGTTFYRSTDNGVTWTNVTTGLPTAAMVDRLAIAVTAASPATIYMIAGSAANAGFYGFYKSTNSGTSFAQVTVTSPSNLLGWASAGNDTGGQGWYDLVIDASPTNANEVCVGGVNIWRTTNGGTSWTLNAHWTGTGAPYVHADHHAMMYLNGTTMFEGCDGGIFKTTNNGTAWTDISANLCIAEIYRIGLSGQAASPNYWITGHQDNGTNIKNGAAYTQTMGGDGMDCFVDRTNNNVMYGEQYQGSLNRTTNGGTNWTAITTGLTGTAPWVTPWHQDPTTANTIYCGRTGLWKSTNQGTSWTQTTAAVPGTGTIVDFKIAPSNNQVIYVVKSNAVYKTVNGGAAWTTITGTLPVGSAAISRVDVKPSDPLTAIVTFSGYSSGNKVFKTTDGGTTWTNISGGLPNLPCNCVRFDASSAINAVYVGCDVGVYYMDNTFGTWQPYFTSLPNVPIDDLEIHAGTSKLRAATYGRGVWEVDIYNPGTLPPVAQFATNPLIACVGAGVNFTDQSSFSPTSWSWTFPSGTPATSTAQNPAGIVWNTAGTYTVTLIATNANGSSTVTHTVTVLGSQAPPLVEGFEAAQFLPVGWTANNINNDAMFWTQATVGSASTKSAMFDNYDDDVAGAQDEMWAPRLNCTAFSTLQMTFDVAYAPYDLTNYPGYSDTLQVLYSLDCGTTWNSVYLKGGATLATAPSQTASIFVPTAAQWRNESVNLNACAGQSSVLVIFRNRGHYGQADYVDNINITGTAAVLPSGTFTASVTSVCAGTPVNFTDNSSGSPTSWTWTFPSGTPPSATTQNVVGVVWNTAGTYTVTHTATNASGTGTTTQVITINALPVVTTTTTAATICAGASTSMTASGATTYTWMPGNLSGATVTVSPVTTTTYTVTGTNAAGCTSTATRTITVNPTPTVTATAAPTTICAGASSTLTGGGASTYNWMPGNHTGSPWTVTPATTTSYTVTGTSAAGCTSTASVTVTVNPTPTVTATAAPTTICAGASTTLTSTGASTYNWMPGNLTGSPQTVTPAATTIYTVTGTSAAGCTSTASVTVTVNPTPTVTATAAPTAICAGASSTLTSAGASTYNWMPGNLSGSPQTVTPAATTTYTVTGTSANGCTSTATALVTVNPLPTVTATSSSGSICTGNNVTLTGGGASTYNWNPGNHNGSPWTVTPASTTTYTVTGTSAAGCTNTATVTVIVGAPPVTTATASATTICVGSSTTLTGGGATTYNWMPGNHTGSPWTVTPAATTTYTVTGSTGPGCQSTATISITVNPLPTVTTTTTGATICSGNSTTITASGGTTYTWMPGNLTGTTVTVTPLVTTTYTVTGTNANGCTNTATRTITVHASPTVTTTATSNSICQGSSVTLTASGASTYNWNPGNHNGTPWTVTPASTTTYTVTGTAANGCTGTSQQTITVNPIPVVTASASPTAVCAGSAVTLTGAGATTYTWMPGNIIGSPVTDNPVANTTYTVTGTAAGCSNTATVSVTVHPTPTVTATASNNTVCAGTTITLTAGGGLTYNWQPHNLTGSPVTDVPIGNTTYTVTGTDAIGCSSTATVAITVNALPNITISPSSNAICIGSSVSLTGSGATTYNWMPGNLSGTTITDSPNATTIYTVTGTDANGCSNTDTATVNVYAQPNITITGNTVVCPGGSVTLTGNGGSTYVWQPGGQTTSVITDNPVTATTYSVTGTDVSGCTNTATFTVTIDVPPTTPTILVNGTLLTSSVTGASYQWFLNGNPIVGATSQSYNAIGLGSYTVEVYDAAGCGSGQSAAVVDPTGIPTVSSVDFVNVIPNPNNGNFVLNFHANKTDNYIIEIHDMLGQIVYKEELDNFSGTYTKNIDLSSYGKGMYTIRLMSSNKETVVKSVTY